MLPGNASFLKSVTFTTHCAAVQTGRENTSFFSSMHVRPELCSPVPMIVGIAQVRRLSEQYHHVPGDHRQSILRVHLLTDILLLLQFTGSGLNNFYGRFCNDSTHNKPMVITETSAMYNPSNTAGSTDLAIKQNWWQQVFNVQGDSSGVRF